MKRSIVIGTVLISAVVVLLANQTVAKSPPNIVFIIADDQSWTDYGFMDNPRVSTPNLDRLAKQSARFPNAYVPSSVCRPSLVTLLTGLYPHQHGVHFNHGPPGNAGYNRMMSAKEYVAQRGEEFKLIRQLPTLPGVLHRELGYRCFQSGKFWEGHYRNGGFTDGMTLFQPPPVSQTYGGIRTLASGERVAHGNGDFGLRIGRETMAPLMQFIDDCESSQTPWMVWYAPYLTHQPHDSPARFYDQAARRPNVAKHELPYFASIAQFDDTVGQLVQYVESKQLQSNTVFVFVSDNGWTASTKTQKSRPAEFQHTKRSKRAPFDEGIRTPILIRWDGMIQQAQHDALVSSIDIVPTLLAAAGADIPNENPLPGINLLPIATDAEKIPADRPVFGGIYPGDARSLGSPEIDIAYRWIRQGQFKLIVPHLHGSEKPWGDYLQKNALYDLALDPHEQNNLIESPSHQESIARLSALLDEWWNPGKN